MPAINLLNLDSTSIFNTTQLYNKETILLYFRPDCSHCQREIHELIEKITHFDQVNVVLISFSPLEEMRSFRNGFNLGTYRNVIIARDLELNFFRYFQPEHVPYLVYYNSNKKIIRIIEGDGGIGMIISFMDSLKVGRR